MLAGGNGLSFPDHPLTVAMNEAGRGGRLKSAKDAISLVKALQYLDRTANIGAYDRLIDFLGLTLAMHQVNCTHEQLRKKRDGVPLREREVRCGGAPGGAMTVLDAVKSAMRRDPELPLIESVESGVVYYYDGEQGEDNVRVTVTTYCGPIASKKIVIPVSRLIAMRVPSPEDWKAMGASWIEGGGYTGWVWNLEAPKETPDLGSIV